MFGHFSGPLSTHVSAATLLVRRRSLGLIGLALFASVALLACNGDDEGETPTPTFTPTATETGTPPPGPPSPTPPPTDTGTPTGTPSPGPTFPPLIPTTPSNDLEEVIYGLSSEPQPMSPDVQRVLAAPPASPFAEHDRESTVLYDTQSGEVMDFGAGDGGFFSPDGRYFAWVSRTSTTPELRVLDLQTREERGLGSEPQLMAFGFIDNTRIEVRFVTSDGQLVDVVTENWADIGDVRPHFSQWQVQGSLLLMPEVNVPGRFRLLDQEPTATTLAMFPAHHASFAGPRELLIVTPWTGSDGTPGTVNIYLVDIDTLESTFVATVALDQYPIIPVGGSAEVIAWTENYCNWPDPAGKTWYLDRSIGELVELDQSVWVTVTPDGRLGYGEFGPHYLIDRGTLRYEVILPEGTIDITWSPNFRYASRGLAYGHGGHCP